MRAYGYDSPRQALEALAVDYQRDRLEGQSVVPWIVIEKQTLVAQMDAWFG